MLHEEPGAAEHVFWERKVKSQGHSCWIRAITTKRISLKVPGAVALPVGMKNLEDCCVHHEEAYAGALRSGGRGNLS